MFYQVSKRVAALFFNLLNLLLGGNLPPFGCVCMVVEQDQRFLVVEQPGGRVVFPGGFMRWHERPEQAMVREGEEETGLRMRPVRVLGHYPIISRSLTRMSTLNIIFWAEVEGGTLRASGEGRPYWLHEDALPDKLNGYYLKVLHEYQQQRKAVQSHTDDVPARQVAEDVS